MAKIITVSGKAQNGKDTFATFAKEYYDSIGKRSIIFHYADFLKFICKQYFDWDGVKDERGRSLLQYVGTGIFRHNDANCWTKMAQAFVSGLGDTVDYVIIPDARFPNEIEHWNSVFSIQKLVKIKIIRPNYDNGLTEEQKNHISETALDDYDFDYEIYNNVSLNKFKERIFKILEDENI